MARQIRCARRAKRTQLKPQRAAAKPGIPYNLSFRVTSDQPDPAEGTEIMFHKDLLLHKRILITGGGTGLGKGMASRFLALGATVYICGRRQPVLEATASELQPKGPSHALPCDVRNLDSVEQMTETIWNDGPLDILVNNAAGNFIARSEDLSPNGWQ